MRTLVIILLSVISVIHTASSRNSLPPIKQNVSVLPLQAVVHKFQKKRSPESEPRRSSCSDLEERVVSRLNPRFEALERQQDRTELNHQLLLKLIVDIQKKIENHQE